jgi:hypothetical protein
MTARDVLVKLHVSNAKAETIPVLLSILSSIDLLQLLQPASIQVNSDKFVKPALSPSQSTGPPLCISLKVLGSGDAILA